MNHGATEDAEKNEKSREAAPLAFVRGLPCLPGEPFLIHTTGLDDRG